MAVDSASPTSTDDRDTSKVDQADFDERRLAEAIALFEQGDYVGAEAAAAEAESSVMVAARQALANVESRPPTEEREGCTHHMVARPSDAEVMEGDFWSRSLDALAAAYEDTDGTEQAEGLYLRMLAWREGLNQFRAGTFSVASQLFHSCPDYNTVDDATWFLRDLHPGDGHLVPEVIGLLALGEQVAAKAAVAVWTLALQPKHRPRITNCGGLELMAKAVAFHGKNAELQAAGCGALRLLCTGHALAARNRVALVESLGGAEALTRSMTFHPQDIEVQREACGALQALAVQHVAGARHVLDNDGMMLCLEAIVSCSNEGVGTAACRALTALKCAGTPAVAEESGSEDEEEEQWRGRLRQEHERALGWCEQELKGRVLSGDRVVLQSLLSAIAILLDDSAVRPSGTGLVEPVVVAMQLFPSQARVQVPSSNVLFRLTAGHPARGDAVKLAAFHGGIGALCQAMRDLPCDGELQRLAVGALRNIAFGNDAYKTLAVRASGASVTIQAMLRFSRDPVLQEHALGALTSLCDTVGRAAACARLGGIMAITSAMRRHAKFGRIAELGCIILCMFCDDALLQQQIVRSGALAIAKTLSRTGTKEARRWGCELLRDLTDSTS